MSTLVQKMLLSIVTTHATFQQKYCWIGRWQWTGSIHL